MLTFGEWNLHHIKENSFLLDGGLIYGLIPKKLWAKNNPPDENNLIQLDTNVYLLQTGKENILVDCGLGDCLDERTRKVYQPATTSQLAEGLAKLGVRREDITHVLFTHLHLDHFGGAIIPGPHHDFVLHFPTAVHWTTEAEWQDATHPNERTSAAYPENLLKVLESGTLRQIKSPTEVLPGLRLLPSGGHTGGHMMIELLVNSHRILFPGDIFPSRHHLRLPFIASADTFPLTTLEVKRGVLAGNHVKETILCMDHDPEVHFMRLNPMGSEPPYEVLG